MLFSGPPSSQVPPACPVLAGLGVGSWVPGPPWVPWEGGGAGAPRGGGRNNVKICEII